MTINLFWNMNKMTDHNRKGWWWSLIPAKVLKRNLTSNWSSHF